MKKYILIISIITATIVITALSPAAETRGLQVIAKDPSSGKQGIVKLYNKSYAVIIGIDKYTNLPANRQLSYAVKDAQGIEEVLRTKYRFDRIVTLYNDQATRENILKVFMDDLPVEMSEEDSLVVFWAGHGNQEKTRTGDIGYLIPYNGQPNKLYTNISMTELKENISKKVPAKHVFFIMDACYSGLLTATRSIDKTPRRDLAYLKEITKEPVRQVLTAGSKGQEVLDGGIKGHSVFTGRLIEVLEATGNFITANEIQAVIREKVYADARSRNHTQTPDFGNLYGMGDFVFIPKEQDRLGDLTGASAARQKELEQLQKMEQEAANAKKREQIEIAKKEKELAALDNQIAEMKTRLGSNSARSGDSLDRVVALAEQKEEQGKLFDNLRKQRETEEENRRQEIEKLKQNAMRKRTKQVEADLAKYHKVASSKYAQDMAGAAWDALLVNYPEAKIVRKGDVDGFLREMGLTRYGTEVVTYEEKRLRDEEYARDIWIDPKTGLMWASKDNGSDIDWQNAKRYCENYRVGGFTDWRMPTMDELSSLYDESSKGYEQRCCYRCGSIKTFTQIQLSCIWVWSSETNGSAAANFDFNAGRRNWYTQSTKPVKRVLPVRKAK